MRAVNLIPADARRSTRVSAGAGGVGLGHVVVGVLVAAVALLTVYVLTQNTISDRQAKIAALQQEVSQVQAQAARLANYAQFQKLAQARVQTVRQIASARFDWHGALSDLSKVVPTDTSLEALVGTVAPGASAGASGGQSISTGALRGDVSSPAFELKGCAHTQDEVARLMSRLRLMNGVTRVTLADSQKLDSAISASTNGRQISGCPVNVPSFDLVIFFAPLAGAGPAGVTAAVAAPVPTAGTPVSAAQNAAGTSQPASTPTSSGAPN